MVEQCAAALKACGLDNTKGGGSHGNDTGQNSSEGCEGLTPMECDLLHNLSD